MDTKRRKILVVGCSVFLLVGAVAMFVHGMYHDAGLISILVSISLGITAGTLIYGLCTNKIN